jgi:hypothetical protein
MSCQSALWTRPRIPPAESERHRLREDQDEGEPDAAMEFRVRIEALSKLNKDEHRVIKTVLDAILLSHHVKRWARTWQSG